MIDIGKALRMKELPKGSLWRRFLGLPSLWLITLANRKRHFPRYDGYIAVYLKKYAEFLNLNGESF